MFKKLFAEKKGSKKVFIIPFHVKPLENSIMPPDLCGAYVSCYAAGETYIDATKSALRKLADDGLHPEEILQPIQEMQVSDWTVHINDLWEAYVSDLPGQSDFEKSIASGKVVYGPFGSYNSE
ncbi:hypothetical protein [Photobacterium sp. 53610]|uniref:hypothetical protein n=1 Tax=Photobacterium sp. 53610 TaxID=3102789 RepID=UPI002ED9D1C3